MTQFRGFVFPSHPRQITLSQNNRVIAHFCPGRGEVLEHLGAYANRIVCKGYFWSQSREETELQVERFLAEARERQPGLLFLPFGAPLSVYLERYSLEAVGDGRIIPYTLTFVREEGL